MSFSGTNQYISNIGQLNTFNFIVSNMIFTIGVDFNLAYIPQVSSNIYAWTLLGNDVAAGNNGFMLRYRTDNIYSNVFEFGEFYGGAGIVGRTPSWVPDVNWHTLNVVGNQTSVVFYVDGRFLTNSYGFIQTNVTATYPMFIGAVPFSSPASTNYFNGNIKNVRIFNRALSSNEVVQLYTGSNITSGLVGYWPLNDQRPTTTTMYGMANVGGKTTNRVNILNANLLLSQPTLWQNVNISNINTYGSTGLTVYGSSLSSSGKVKMLPNKNIQ